MSRTLSVAGRAVAPLARRLDISSHLLCWPSLPAHRANWRGDPRVPAYTRDQGENWALRGRPVVVVVVAYRRSESRLCRGHQSEVAAALIRSAGRGRWRTWRRSSCAEPKRVSREASSPLARSSTRCSCGRRRLMAATPWRLAARSSPATLLVRWRVIHQAVLVGRSAGEAHGAGGCGCAGGGEDAGVVLGGVKAVGV